MERPGIIPAAEKDIQKPIRDANQRRRGREWWGAAACSRHAGPQQMETRL